MNAHGDQREEDCSSDRRAAARGVTLVEVLIVVSIMAVISGGAVVLAFPLYKEARIKTAVVSAKEIKKAAQLYQEMDATTEGCPTIADLVAAKRVDSKTADDPWGKPSASPAARATSA